MKSGRDSEGLFERAGRLGRLDAASRAPLPDRMRPQTLDEVVGQAHLVGPGKWLRQSILGDNLGSLIFWGPPGVGKTSLAQVIAHATRRKFVPFSAVLGGVPELRAILKEAEEERKYRGGSTILFVDEIHRFNKAQQDAFLPHVERGTVTLIGATTENPSFAVNAAVLSRARVLKLESLATGDIVNLLERALVDDQRGVTGHGLQFSSDALLVMAEAADGDARRALHLLEEAVNVLGAPKGAGTQGAAESAALPRLVEREELAPLIENKTLLYDKAGDEHYNVISAFIKSMRGSDPDAAIYWLMRMVEAGEDPLFLLRRMMIFASEDVGNADPRALSVAVDADQAFRRMGMPEGLYPMAQACLYLASCPKSGAVGKAFSAARELIRARGALPVPKKLRNAPTRLMKEEGYGEGYQYAHDFDEGFVPGETYLPDAIVGTQFYHPTKHGLEQSIKERLERIRAARKK
jgi:putative ATPase